MLRATRCYKTWQVADLISPKPDHSPPASKSQKPPKPRKYLNETERQELRRLRAEGWTLAALARRFGVSVGTAFRIVNES